MPALPFKAIIQSLCAARAFTSPAKVGAFFFARFGLDFLAVFFPPLRGDAMGHSYGMI
jgi:hypothetical protein